MTVEIFYKTPLKNTFSGGGGGVGSPNVMDKKGCGHLDFRASLDEILVSWKLDDGTNHDTLMLLMMIEEEDDDDDDGDGDGVDGWWRQCQRSHCCLLADREHLPLLILELLWRRLLRLRLLQLLGFRLLLRHLFRLCLLRLLLMHLLKVL